jgi:hypothetical protein
LGVEEQAQEQISKCAAMSAFVCDESQSPDRSSWPANEPTEVRFTWRVSGMIFATGAPARSMLAQGRAVEAVCRSAEHEVWVAVEGGRPVGFVAVRYGEEDAARAGEIEMVAVDPRCQRAARTTSPGDRMLERLLGPARPATTTE